MYNTFKKLIVISAFMSSGTYATEEALSSEPSHATRPPLKQIKENNVNDEALQRLGDHLEKLGLLKPLQDARGSLKNIEDPVMFRRVREAMLNYALIQNMITLKPAE